MKRQDKKPKKRLHDLDSKHPELGLGRGLKAEHFEVVFCDLTALQKKAMSDFDPWACAETIVSAACHLAPKESVTALRIEGLVSCVASDFGLEADKIQEETVALVLFLSTLRLVAHKPPSEAELAQIAIAAGLDPPLADPDDEPEREQRRARWRGIRPTKAYLDGVTQPEDIEPLTLGALRELRSSRDTTRPRSFHARR